MKQTKKILSLFMCLIMVLSICSCGGSDTSKKSSIVGRWYTPDNVHTNRYDWYEFFSNGKYNEGHFSYYDKNGKPNRSNDHTGWSGKYEILQDGKLKIMDGYGEKTYDLKINHDTMEFNGLEYYRY